METFSALLALCEGNSPVTGEFTSQRPVTRSFDVSSDLRLNKRLIKQSRRRWFEMPCAHYDVTVMQHRHLPSSGRTMGLPQEASTRSTRNNVRTRVASIVDCSHTVRCLRSSAFYMVGSRLQHFKYWFEVYGSNWIFIIVPHNENGQISISVPLKFVCKGTVDDKLAFVRHFVKHWPSIEWMRNHYLSQWWSQRSHQQVNQQTQIYFYHDDYQTPTGSSANPGSWFGVRP